MDERMRSREGMDGELEQALQQGLARRSAPDGLPDGLEERILAAAMAARQAKGQSSRARMGGRAGLAGGLAGRAGMRLLRGGLGRAGRMRDGSGGSWALQRIAASVALGAMVAGAVAFHQNQERHKAEQARAQVLEALRITSRTLDKVQTQLNDGQ